MKKILAVVLCLGFTSYAAAEIDFNRAVDIEEAMESSSDYGFNIPDAKWRGNSWYTEQCNFYHVDRSVDTEYNFEERSFSSQEWVQECYTDYAFETGTHCSDIPGRSWNLKGQLILKPTINIYPWEKEIIKICIHGPKLDLRLVDTAYKYDIERAEGGSETTFILTPKWRNATKPDADGIEIADFVYDKEAKKFVLNLKDIWSKEYAGEKIVIKAEFRKDLALWPDSSIEEKEFEFEVSDNYKVSFDKNGVGKGFIKWSFKRVGEISTGEYIYKGETSRAVSY